jgi:hypothetical protein
MWNCLKFIVSFHVQLVSDAFTDEELKQWCRWGAVETGLDVEMCDKVAIEDVLATCVQSFFAKLSHKGVSSFV